MGQATRNTQRKADHGGKSLISIQKSLLCRGKEPEVPAALHRDGRDELLNVTQKEGDPSCLQDAAGKCTNISLVEQDHPSAR